MSLLAVQGGATGTGTVTLLAPVTNTNRTLTLPDQTATLITDSAAILNIGSGQVYKDASGNVGIGTTTPTRKLTIAGTGAFSSTAAPSIRLDDTASSRLALIDFDSSQNLNVWAGTDTGAIRFITNTGAGTERARIDSSGNFQMNSGYGSVATAFGCRAWVDFNGQGTVAIRGSGNVSSITDNTTGSYTVNFTTAMPDVNFAVTGTAGSKDNDGTDNGVVCLFNRSTSSASIFTRNVQSSGGTTDYDAVNVAIFR